MNGNVQLADWNAPHQFIRDLFVGNDLRSGEFLKNIRAYNSMFCFVSLGVQLDSRLESDRPNRGPFCFNL